MLIRLAVYSKGKNAKKYRRGIEYGSARWGTPADIAPYADPDFFQNVLLTQTERITMSSRSKEPKYARNKNILVIGGSGSGKTRFFVKPNLLQCHSSYVVTDPKGTILCEVGALLERKGYRIKSLNLINFKKSMRYNPPGVYPLGEGYFEAGERPDPQHQGRGRKEFRGFLGQCDSFAGGKSQRTNNKYRCLDNW